MTNQIPDKPVRKKRKHRRKRHVFLSILFILILMGLLACLMVGCYVISLRDELPDIMFVQLECFFDPTEGGWLGCSEHPIPKLR